MHDHRRLAHAFLVGLLLTAAGAAHAEFHPWDALVDDSWIYFGPPQSRIVMHTVNGGDYEVGFDQCRSDHSARGMNALQFAQGGADTGHLVTSALSGSFEIRNAGDNRTFADLLILLAIDAMALPECFTLSLGEESAIPYSFDRAADFGYYQEPAYDSGRPSGYYSLTSPTGEGISHSFEAGMVTVFAALNVNLAPATSTTIQYEFSGLPGDAVFSVYGFDSVVGWVYHTNRATIDDNRPSGPVSTFTVRPLPGDWDGDGEVSLDDFVGFGDCTAGPGAPPVPRQSTADKCLIVFDFDRDDDVDLADFAAFAEALAG